MMGAKATAKRLARALLGDYSVYRIYRLDPRAGPTPPVQTGPRQNGLTLGPVARADFDGCDDALLREQAFYFGEQAQAYACRRGAQWLGLCFFWWGERYRTRNFWPLAEREAKLVQIVTAESARGQGVAPRLLAHAAQDMAARGFGPLYARIWHSNRPSIAAFERAGWTWIATIAQVHPLRRRKPLRLVWRRRGAVERAAAR